MKNCNGCIHAIYDTFDYGSTTVTMLTDCACTEKMSEEEYDKIMDDEIDCPYEET